MSKPRPKKSAPTSKPAPRAEASISTMPIASAIPDAANARKRTDRNSKTIRASLSRFGAGRSIVLDGKNVVRAGNGTLEQAAEAGFNEILVIEPAANQIVAVKRPEWSDAEATAYAIADNRSSELAEWDDEALAEAARMAQSDESIGLDAIGFTDDEITALCEEIGDGILEGAGGQGGDDIGVPPVSRYSEQYGVIVICKDENEQATVYEALAASGYNCKVVCT